MCFLVKPDPPSTKSCLHTPHSWVYDVDGHHHIAAFPGCLSSCRSAEVAEDESPDPGKKFAEKLPLIPPPKSYEGVLEGEKTPFGG
jgi:hypothetical protein